MKEMVQLALIEDIGSGDVTSEATIPADLRLTGVLKAKEAGVIAGLAVARLVFTMLDERMSLETLVEDGDWVEPGTVLGRVTGPGRALLSGERIALNILQRMSGIATLTRRYVSAVAGTKAVILDTRKTAPGLRLLDKWAVCLGGGQNHRFGLYDMALIKDNHITAVGGITAAVERVRAGAPGLPIEVEVKNLDELRETLALPVDRIMLDNMNPAVMRQAVEIADGRIPLEASGNISLDNVAAVAATGVDFISAGALTHSAKALDISLKIEPQ
jgi:nicotinate-nucleotide pyrophosphorylase (carboxylating)